MDMYIDKPIRSYLDDLAAKIPAPGGGSAAALEAALGASLMSMVANYTIGNKRYKGAEEKTSSILNKTEESRRRLERLIDEDVIAYRKISEGIKSAANDKAKLDDMYKNALRPPLAVCEISAECLRLCSQLADIGNKNLITDTAISAMMLESAFFSAKYNVYINLKYITDTKHIDMIHSMLSPLEVEVPRMKEDIIEKCEEVIQRGDR